MTIEQAYERVVNIGDDRIRKMLRKQIIYSINSPNIESNLDVIFKNVETKETVSKDHAKLFK